MKTRIPPFLVIFSVATFVFLLNAKSVSPPPDGGYPGFNTAEGTNALKNLSTGVANTAVGWFSLFSNTDGSFNTAVGAGTLLFNVGDQSTGEGVSNTGIGTAALLFNTTGSDNTAVGVAALLNNDSGVVNTAIGSRALQENTDGNFNTAVGTNALFANTSGQENTAVGNAALGNSPPGNFNTAVGSIALLNTTGGQNTGCGRATLANNTTGSGNTAVGDTALFGSTGSGNSALGHNAGGSVTTASNVICIGTSGENVDNSCYIGNIYFNVQPIVGTDPDSVTITSAGRLGRGNVSSRRYKHDIKSMDQASEVLFALKPVSFRYNKEHDATQTLAFGLIAEEVAEVAPDLVGRNPEGQPESVRYDQINAMLLNEFLKEHKKVGEQDRKLQEQQAIIAQLEQDFQSKLAKQQKEIKALTAGLENVSAQLKTGRPVPKVAATSP
jgi:hypothetical protein